MSRGDVPDAPLQVRVRVYDGEDVSSVNLGTAPADCVVPGQFQNLGGQVLMHGPDVQRHAGWDLGDGETSVIRIFLTISDSMVTIVLIMCIIFEFHGIHIESSTKKDTGIKM